MFARLVHSSLQELSTDIRFPDLELGESYVKTIMMSCSVVVPVSSSEVGNCREIVKPVFNYRRGEWLPGVIVEGQITTQQVFEQKHTSNVSPTIFMPLGLGQV